MVVSFGYLFGNSVVIVLVLLCFFYYYDLVGYLYLLVIAFIVSCLFVLFAFGLFVLLGYWLVVRFS